MMTRTFPVLVLMMVLSMAFAGTAHAQAKSVFRGFVWGVSMEDVRRYEKGIFFEQVENSLIFLEEVNGHRALVRYDFQNDALWRAKYEYVDLSFPRTEPALDLIIDTQRALTRRFGKPVREGLMWNNTRYKNHPEFFTRAFGSGHVGIEADWDKDGTAVAMRAIYDQPYYQLEYTLENAAMRQEQMRLQPFGDFEGLN